MRGARDTFRPIRRVVSDIIIRGRTATVSGASSSSVDAYGTAVIHHCHLPTSGVYISATMGTVTRPPNQLTCVINPPDLLVDFSSRRLGPARSNAYPEGGWGVGMGARAYTFARRATE